MRINYFSPVAMSLAVLPRMLERSSGMIVNVSSLGGRLGITAEAAYSGSKFALAGWSESWCVDLDGTGVVGQAHHPGCHRHRNLGPARQRRPALRRAEGAARGHRRRHRRRHRQRPVRALPARHESDDRGQDIRHRQLHRRHARHDRAARKGRNSEGTGLRRSPRTGGGAAHPHRRARDDAGRHPLRPAPHRRRPARPSRLGRDPAHPLGHLRVRRQARAGRLQHGRHRQPDGRLLLTPPRARARGRGRGGRARSRGPRARRGPARRAQPLVDVRAARASRPCARPARPATSACAGASPRATSAPACTSASSPARPAPGPNSWRPTTPC